MAIPARRCGALFVCVALAFALGSADAEDAFATGGPNASPVATAVIGDGLTAGMVSAEGLHGNANPMNLLVPQSAYSTDVTISIDQSSYAVAIGQTLEVRIKVETNEAYEVGAHKYIGYFAYYSHNQWNQVQSWYIDGGSALYTMKMTLQSWEETSNYLFVASVFPIDAFSTGNSLVDRYFYVDILPEFFTVTLDAAGGYFEMSDGLEDSPGEEPATATAKTTTTTKASYNREYGDLAEPVRDGYVFDGWFTAERGGSRVTSTSVVEAQTDHILYAHWSEKPKVSLETATLVLAGQRLTYTGDQLKPSVSVICDSKVLDPSKDYVIAFGANTDVGDGTVTVAGIGDYTGSKAVSFDIVPATIGDDWIAVSSRQLTYSGHEQKPAVSVSNDLLMLTEGVDYKVAYSNNIQAGVAVLTVSGLGNYTGSTVRRFTISPASIAGASVRISQSSYTYDGTAKRPGVTVVAAGRELRQGSDYAVSYAGNVNAGTAKVVVTGAGSYSGSLTKVFRIDRAKLAGGAVGLSSARYVYSGKARKPAVVVRAGGRVLRAGRDYAVSYPKGRAAVGSYAVRVQGKGNYSGSASASFSIVPKGTRIASLKWVADGSRSGFAARWARQAAQASGYELSWSLSGSFSGAKSCRYAAASKFAKRCAVNKAVPKSWRGKRAYVRIRTYKTVGGRTYVSAWSKAKSVVVKK